MADSWSIDSFLSDYRPVEKVVPITARGDLLGRLAQLEEDLATARERADDGGLGDGGDALAAAIVEPPVDRSQIDKLLDALSPGQVRKLVGALIEVNGGGDDLPKSAAPSVLRQASVPKRRTSSRGDSQDLFSSDGL